MMNSENFGDVLYLGDEFEYGPCPHMAGGSGSQGGCGGSGGCGGGGGCKGGSGGSGGSGGNAVSTQVSSDND